MHSNHRHDTMAGVCLPEHLCLGWQVLSPLPAPRGDRLRMLTATNRCRFDALHPTIRSFWRFVHSSTISVQRKLLSFVTGSDRAPLGGLGKLSLLIQRAGPDTNLLP